jgi:hypothetical protein
MRRFLLAGRVRDSLLTLEWATPANQSAPAVLTAL